MPRTNSGLDRAFGGHGITSAARPVASPALVLWGAAERVTGLATRHREVTTTDLAGADRGAWRQLRDGRSDRRECRLGRGDPEVT
ncbi:hypothetical protein [Gemmata massiliana]|uniref:hypothetical protein n=1 Tax=Gemmata massiliana TaxID=1210884 RepID=UPI0013A68EFC|nr:hypothetical protein [Gemmata massiliana]